jgi:hypothetical protein
MEAPLTLDDHYRTHDIAKSVRRSNVKVTADRQIDLAA